MGFHVDTIGLPYLGQLCRILHSGYCGFSWDWPGLDHCCFLGESTDVIALGSAVSSLHQQIMQMAFLCNLLGWDIFLCVWDASHLTYVLVIEQASVTAESLNLSGLAQQKLLLTPIKFKVGFASCFSCSVSRIQPPFTMWTGTLASFPSFTTFIHAPMMRTDPPKCKTDGEYHPGWQPFQKNLYNGKRA